MDKFETVLENYKASRSELIMRVRLRDHVLLVYLTFVGVVFGFSLKSGLTSKLDTSVNLESLMMLPFLALGCSILVSQHNAVIGALIRFNTEHIGPFLIECGAAAPEFTNSEAFKTHSPKSNFLRSFGHGVILLIPCVISLGLNYEHGIKSPFPLGVVWWFGLLCTFGTLWVINHVHSFRKEVFDKTSWYSE